MSTETPTQSGSTAERVPPSAPAQPTPAPLWRRVWWWVSVVITAPVFFALFRLRTGQWENCPKEGGLLVLANHTSALDPAWLGHYLSRNGNFMASSALMRTPFLGKLVASFGGFPKNKFVKDPAAMGHLNDLYTGGQIVVMFPEGSRTFDGRLGPVLPGVARLIHRLDARVMFAKIETGHLVHPRWARWPRWVPLKIRTFPPRSFTGMDEASILAAVVEAITIDADVDAPPGSYGFRMAEGLPSYLWACMSCGEIAGLTVPSDDRNAVRCASCGASWSVDVSCRLTPRTPGASAYRVSSAFDAISARFGARPKDPKAPDGALLADRGRVREVQGSLQVDGQLVLTESGLTVRGDDGAERFALSLADVVAVSVEVGGVLQLGTADGLFQVEPARTSPLCWGYFVERWRAVIGDARPSTATA